MTDGGREIEGRAGGSSGCVGRGGGCSCDNDRALNGPDDPCVDVAHDPLKAIADDPGNIIIGAGNTGDGI